MTLFIVALLLALAAAIAHAAYWFLRGIKQPIADAHQFRQTQTAITAYWLWHGGPRFAYETPVLGYPWSIPFEFPYYQHIVATLKWCGVPIPIGGRIVSFVFYVGILWPLWLIAGALGVSLGTYLMVAILLMSSPLYIYWSRTVMIESTALFLALCWLGLLLQFIRYGFLSDAICAIVFGILAINVKVTTFLPIGAMGAAAVLLGRLSEHAMITASLVGVIPLVTAVYWIAFTDRVKRHHPLASTELLSGLMVKWNFGTWAQRCSAQLWLGKIEARTLADTLGFSVIPAMIAAGAAINEPLFWFAIFGFFAPMLIFTNLHIEHNYYPYANAVFLLIAVGLGLGSMSPWLAATLLVFTVAGQLLYFRIGFAQVITADYSQSLQVRAGALAKSLTMPYQSIMIFGDDWSSAIAFNAERRSLTLPYWAKADAVGRILADPQAHLGDAPLGAIVYCEAGLGHYRHGYDEIKKFLNGRKILGETAGCYVLSAAGR